MKQNGHTDKQTNKPILVKLLPISRAKRTAAFYDQKYGSIFILFCYEEYPYSAVAATVLNAPSANHQKSVRTRGKREKNLSAPARNPRQWKEIEEKTELTTCLFESLHCARIIRQAHIFSTHISSDSSINNGYFLLASFTVKLLLLLLPAQRRSRGQFPRTKSTA